MRMSLGFQVADHVPQEKARFACVVSIIESGTLFTMSGIPGLVVLFRVNNDIIRL